MKRELIRFDFDDFLKQDGLFAECKVGATQSRFHRDLQIEDETKVDFPRKLAGEGFKRPWPPLIRMAEEVRRKIEAPFKTNS